MAICELIKDVAEGVGFEVSVVSTAEAFHECIRNAAPDVIVLDLSMPSDDGIQLMRSLGEEKTLAKVLLISGADKRVLATAQRLGETHGLDMLEALQKPIMIDALEQTLLEGIK